MKKNLIFAFLLSCFALVSVYADNSELKIRFIKGNIADKTAVVREAGGTSDSFLAVDALDFIIQNQEILKDDRDLSALAVATILSYPADEYSKAKAFTVQKFDSVFNNFSDNNVKISILDKMESLNAENTDTNSIKFINTYLENASLANKESGVVEKKAILTLGKIGTNSSYSLLYKCLKMQIWPNLNNELKASIISIADKSVNEICSSIKEAEFPELKMIFSLYIENDKISDTLKSEIAENILNKTMFITKDVAYISNDMIDFQVNILKLLGKNKWTRASELVLKYFDTAKKVYKDGVMKENQFIDVIQTLTTLASRACVKSLVDYMNTLNKEVDANQNPSTAVTLAVIKALSTLGDKSAFDCLWYATYINYPQEVVTAARDALASLKW